MVEKIKTQKGFIQISLLIAIILAVVIVSVATTGVVLHKQGKLSPLAANISEVFEKTEEVAVTEEIESEGPQIEQPEISQEEILQQELEQAKRETEKAKAEAERLRKETEEAKRLAEEQERQKIQEEPPKEIKVIGIPIEEPAEQQKIQEEQEEVKEEKTLEGTEVGGIISSDTTWERTDSPYIITSTVQIPSGITLTIEPGVTVRKPTSGDMFLLMGAIRAHGTAQESIVFDGGGNSTIVGTYPAEYGKTSGYGDFEHCVFKNGYSLWDRWGYLTLRYSQIINLTTGSQKAIGGASIKLDNPSGEINIEYNKFVNTGGIYSYANNYGINIKYNLFQGILSPLTNAGGGTPQTPNEMVVKFNSFVGIEGIILSLEPVFSPTIDATHNYWGTTDTAVIDLKIHDGHDDIRIGSYITYLPILTSPHPNTPSPD